MLNSLFYPSQVSSSAYRLYQTTKSAASKSASEAGKAFSSTLITTKTTVTDSTTRAARATSSAFFSTKAAFVEIMLNNGIYPTRKAYHYFTQVLKSTSDHVRAKATKIRIFIKTHPLTSAAAAIVTISAIATASHLFSGSSKFFSPPNPDQSSLNKENSGPTPLTENSFPSTYPFDDTRACNNERSDLLFSSMIQCKKQQENLNRSFSQQCDKRYDRLYNSTNELNKRREQEFKSKILVKDLEMDRLNTNLANSERELGECSTENRLLKSLYLSNKNSTYINNNNPTIDFKSDTNYTNLDVESVRIASKKIATCIGLSGVLQFALLGVHIYAPQLGITKAVKLTENISYLLFAAPFAGIALYVIQNVFI